MFKQTFGHAFFFIARNSCFCILLNCEELLFVQRQTHTSLQAHAHTQKHLAQPVDYTYHNIHYFHVIVRT